jgi:hypothetical protein
MSSYLEAYGEAEGRREKRVRIFKISSIVLGCVLVVGLIFYGIFRNYGEEQQAKTFIDLLRAHDYQRAYQLWCTNANPCPAYPFSKFLEDWGPQSVHADESSARMGLSQSCGSGVVIQIDYKGSDEPVALWVERDTKTISFAPYAECPGRHLRIGAFFRSLFGRS